MAQLYADENFPLSVVVALRQLGHDVLTVREAGNDNQRISDQSVLEYAVSQKRALITINRRDFIRLHQQQPLHSGIIVCTENADSASQAQQIDALLRSTEQLDGVLLRVNRQS